MPTTPQKAAGSRMEPPVSVPSAPKQRPAATAAAEPPEEPPAMRLRSQGLRVGPKQLGTEVPPYANSCMFNLPKRTAPARLKRLTTAASVAGIRSLNNADAAVVRIPAVSIMSL